MSDEFVNEGGDEASEPTGDALVPLEQQGVLSPWEGRKNPGACPIAAT